MISINTLIMMFVWGMLMIVPGVFMTNPEELTALSPVWVGIALCAVSLFLFLLQWFYGALSRYRSRNKKSESRENTHER